MRIEVFKSSDEILDLSTYFDELLIKTVNTKLEDIY